MNKIILSFVFFVISVTSFSQVGIGTSDPKAALDITATDSGILIPRMNTLTRTGLTVTANQNGMMVYDTDTKTFWYYEISETDWLEIKVATAKFVDGTTESKDAVFTAGNVGIGTTDPKSKLDVNGIIKIGNSTNTPVAGMIKYDGTDFFGYTGTAWQKLNN